MTQKENVIVLSEAFWNEVQAHPIPLNRNIVRAFTHAPGTLHFYMWLSWRSYKLTRLARIPLFGRNGLSAQLGAAEYARERDFRRTVSRWIASVRQFWRDCSVSLSDDGCCWSAALTVHRRLWIPEIFTLINFVASAVVVDSVAYEIFHVKFVAGKYVKFVARVARNFRDLIDVAGLPEDKIPEEELPDVVAYRCGKDSTEARAMRR